MENAGEEITMMVVFFIIGLIILFLLLNCDRSVIKMIAAALLSNFIYSMIMRIMYYVLMWAMATLAFHQLRDLARGRVVF
jgi:hypothetical protein